MKGVPKMCDNWYAVLERDYRIKDTDFSVRYIGSPCQSVEEAVELIYAHGDWGEEISVMCFDKRIGSYTYAETSIETGEILKEFFIRKI